MLAPLAAILCAMLQESPDWATLQEQLQQLASDNPLERSAAREAVRKEAHQAYQRALSDKGKHVTAALALGLVGDESAKPLLLHLAQKGDTSTRACAFEAMAGLKVQPAIFHAALELEPRIAFAAARAWARSDLKSVQAAYEALQAKRSKRGVEMHATPLTIALLVGLAESQPFAWMWKLRSSVMDNPSVETAERAAIGYCQLVSTKDQVGTDPGLLRKISRREDFSPSTHELGVLTLLRAGMATEDEIGSYLKHPSPAVRKRALLVATPAEPAKLQVGLWLHWLRDAQVAAACGKAIESWIIRATGVKAEGDRSARIRKWEKWWETHVEVLLIADTDKAVTRGVDYLKSRYNDGHVQGAHTVGASALGVYTLLKCDLPVTDPLIEGSLQWLQQQPLEEAMNGLEGGVYRTAVMALAFAEAEARWKSVKNRKPGQIDVRCRRQLGKVAAYLVRAQRQDGGWGYRADEKAYVDTSLTQYALLGLRAAQNSGATVSAEVWRRAAAWLSSTQNEDGGWGYVRGPSYGSMTAAGLSGILIAQSGSGDIAGKRAIDRSLEWLAKNWSINGHLKPDGSIGSGLGTSYYWLWSLERCCLVGDFARIGTHDWYREGALHILNRQATDGSWNEALGLADHCFALLFLKRAFVPVATPSSAK